MDVCCECCVLYGQRSLRRVDFSPRGVLLSVILKRFCTPRGSCAKEKKTDMYVWRNKSKGLPQQAEVAQRVPGRLRPRICLTFGTTRVVGRQPYTPAAFTPRRNLWYSFLEAESTSGHMVPSVTTEKNSQWHHRGSIPGPSD
jgi:hypothetical protein